MDNKKQPWWSPVHTKNVFDFLKRTGKQFTLCLFNDYCISKELPHRIYTPHTEINGSIIYPSLLCFLALALKKVNIMLPQKLVLGTTDPQQLSLTLHALSYVKHSNLIIPLVVYWGKSCPPPVPCQCGVRPTPSPTQVLNGQITVLYTIFNLPWYAAKNQPQSTFNILSGLFGSLPTT